jgi:CheY-like chemotaxis protein
MKYTPLPQIHIIDKNPSYRKVVEGFVRALGYPVTSTESCEQLLSERKKPDIIILDHDLGADNLTGLDFMHRYGQKHFPDTRFVFLTSTTSLDIALSSLRGGAIDYIIKSKSGLERLVKRIDALVGSYHFLRRLKRHLIYALVLLTIFGLTLILAIFQYNNQLI